MDKNKINVFGLSIDNISLEDVFERFDHMIANNKKGYIVTPNVDHVVKLRSDDNFKKIYSKADLVLNDSMIIKRSAKILGHHMKDKLSGSDLLPLTCEYSSKKDYSLFFLGGMPGVAEKAKDNLEKKYPGLNVSGTYSPPFGFEKDDDELKRIVDYINLKSPNILFVGLGAPKQEKFSHDFIDKLNVNIILCTGAAFDFQAGHVKRAPLILQKMGLEWFYRFYKEPRRLFKRYFVDDMKFFFIFLEELFGR